MSNLLNGFKNAVTNKTGKGDKKTYGLTEVLGIMAMVNEKMKPAEIAELTGRTIHSIRYKFFEGTVTINGVTQQRSVGKYGTYEELYAAHGVKTIPDDIEADVAARLEEYKEVLANKTSAA